jgi:hypothetical protein
MSKQSLLETLTDFYTLCYHEARNVRFLVRDGYANAENYVTLQGLPANRNDAWSILQPVRQKATRALMAIEVREVFEQRFKLGLRDLVILFRNQGWYHSSRGGNKWAEIASTVNLLGVALENGDIDNARSISLQLMKMQHNNGNVIAKLHQLDQTLGKG